MITNSTEEKYSVKFIEIEVVNGFLNDENPEIEATGYSITEYYDVIKACCNSFALKIKELNIDDYF